jgi:VWFA-related protein
MRSKFNVGRLGFFLGALLLMTAGISNAQTKPAAAGTTTFTVTAVGKKGAAPTLNRDDIQLFQGKEKKQILDWNKGDQLALMILIDDSVDSSIANNWNDLKEFINAQSPSTVVGVGYIRNNTTMVAQDFTSDHALAAKALRIPLGVGALGSSPYLATMDMLKRWPNTGVRRSILLISSGIDYFRGGGYGMFSPDLDSLISRAERQNTNIWSIYYPSSGHRGRGFYQLNQSQNNLDKLSEDTGAESFYLGTGMPVNLKPYFDEVAQHLNNQYLLSFAGTGGAKGKYQSMKVKTEVPDVELLTPAAVYLPPSK